MTMSSFREYLTKLGEGSPVWVRIPGTPFTMIGSSTRYERLPGMIEWAPTDVITRVGKGLAKDYPPNFLAEQEGERGLLKNLVGGGVAGTTAGLLGGRLLGGEASLSPVFNLWKKGLSGQTLRNLKNVPLPMKLAPLLGAGLGLAAGKRVWESGKKERENQAKEVSKGLLAEQVLQTDAINRAWRALHQKNPAETASSPMPLVASLGTMGV